MTQTWHYRQRSQPANWGTHEPRSGNGREPGPPRREYDSRVGWPRNFSPTGMVGGKKSTERELSGPLADSLVAINRPLAARMPGDQRKRRSAWLSICRAPLQAPVHHLTYKFLNNKY